jgi:hypothetical protein
MRQTGMDAMLRRANYSYSTREHHPARGALIAVFGPPR